MQQLFDGKIKEFFAGSIVGFLAGIKFLFADPVTPFALVVEYSLKFIAVIIFSFASGIMTMLAKDIYTHKISPWLKKKFKPNTQDDES